MAFITSLTASAGSARALPTAIPRSVRRPPAFRPPPRAARRASSPIIHDFQELDAHLANRSISSDEFLDRASSILRTGYLHEQYGYGPVSASRLLYQLRRVVSSDQWDPLRSKDLDKFLLEWYASVNAIGGLRVFEARALSNVVFALAGIGRSPSPAFLEDWQVAATAQIAHFNPQELTLCLQAFNGFQESEVSEKFIEAWMRAAHHRLHEFTDQALINSFHVLAKLGHQPTPTLLADWVDLVIPRIDHLEPVGLCNLLHTISKFDTPVPRILELMKAWSDATAPSLHRWNDQSLSVIIYSLGHLQEKSACPPSDELIQAWYKAVKARLSTLSLSCQGLSNTIYALGKLQVEPDEEFLQLWDRAARWKINEFTPQHFSNMIVGFCSLRIQPTRRFMLVWYAYAEPEDFTSQGLANSIAALIRLGYTELPNEFLWKWVAATQSALPEFTSQELCSTLYAVTQIRWTESPKALLANWSTQAAHLMSEFSARELSMSLHLFGRLAIVPSAVFLEAWQPAVLAKEAEFSPAQTLSIIVALGRLALHSLTESIAFRQFVQRALGSEQTSSLSHPDLMRARAALVQLRMADI